MIAGKRTTKSQFFNNAAKTAVPVGMTAGLLSFTAMVWGLCELYGRQQERSYYGPTDNLVNNSDTTAVVALSIVLSLIAFSSTAILLCVKSEPTDEHYEGHLKP